MNWFKRHYNRISAKKHGWHPSWFAPYLSEFDNELQDSIIKFQVEHDLKPDGLVGPITYRRLLANRELRLENKKSEQLRGGGKYENVLSGHVNLILIWGCRPTHGVKAQT